MKVQLETQAEGNRRLLKLTPDFQTLTFVFLKLLQSPVKEAQSVPRLDVPWRAEDHVGESRVEVEMKSKKISPLIKVLC